MTTVCIAFYESYLSKMSAQPKPVCLYHREGIAFRKVASKDEPKFCSVLHGFVCVSLMAAGEQVGMLDRCSCVQYFFKTVNDTVCKQRVTWINIGSCTMYMYIVHY